MVRTKIFRLRAALFVRFREKNQFLIIFGGRTKTIEKLDLFSCGSSTLQKPRFHTYFVIAPVWIYKRSTTGLHFTSFFACCGERFRNLMEIGPPRLF